MSVFFFPASSFLSWVSNPVDGLLLIAAIFTTSVFIEASTACKCFIPLFYFFGLSNGVVVTYALMVGCFSLLCSSDEMDNGQWTQFVAWSLRDFVFFLLLVFLCVLLLACFSFQRGSGVCCAPVCFLFSVF